MSADDDDRLATKAKIVLKKFKKKKCFKIEIYVRVTSSSLPQRVFNRDSGEAFSMDFIMSIGHFSKWRKLFIKLNILIKENGGMPVTFLILN